MAATETRRVLTVGARPEQILDAWQTSDIPHRVLGHLAQLASPTGRDDAGWAAPVEVVDAGCRWRARAADGELTGTLALRPAPNDLGTEVTLAVRSVEGSPAITSATVFEALHRFKSLVEAGEIPTLDHNPHARHSGPDPH